MNKAPKWFVVVAVIALIWNLLGCAAYLMDVMMSTEDIAKLPADQQAMYAARPGWSVGATAVAVWFGALGCLALILRKRWAFVLLVLSLLGVIVQDVALFGLSGAGAAGGPVAYAMQGVVLVVAILLVLLARKGIREQWLV
jgi:hypothetical protein